MADSQLAAHSCDQISQVRAMPDVLEERAVFFVHCLPIRTVHLCVVEELALNAPRLTKNLRPLGSRIDQSLELRHVDRAIANFGWAVRRHDTPAASGRTATCLIQKLLLVLR